MKPIKQVTTRYRCEADRQVLKQWNCKIRSHSRKSVTRQSPT